jgi:hypothetical protein
MTNRNKIMIDLRNCKKGDKLISKHGETLTYVEYQPEQYFPHLIEYADGSVGSRTDEGWVGKNMRYERDHDIVKVNQPKRNKLNQVNRSIRDVKMELRAAIDDFLDQFNPTSARRLMDAQDAMKVARKRADENERNTHD